MSGITWQEFEGDNYDIIRGGISGQYGDMPPELWLKKMESTCMFERESQLDEHFRSTLKDRVPDKASLAQDLPKENQNQIRSEVMNVRHCGARTAAEPIHPDLFLGHLERDNRGYRTGTNFRKFNGQSWSRGKFKDFSSDHASDWTIPEGTRSEMRAIRDLRNTIGPTRQRMKIFETGRGNWTNSGLGHSIGKGSRKLRVSDDGVKLNLNMAIEPGQRSGYTKNRSDKIKVGYRTTGDHRFKVAQYGILSKKDQKRNIWQAQQRATGSHNIARDPKEIKNRLLVNIMKEVGRRKHLDKYREEVDLDESILSNNVIKKLSQDLHVVRRNTKQTSEVGELGYVGDNISRKFNYDPVVHDMVIVDVKGNIIENKNIRMVNKYDNKIGWRVNPIEGKTQIPQSMEVHVYSSRKNAIGKLPVKIEHKWHDTDFAPVYKRNMTVGHLDTKSSLMGQGTNPTEGKTFDRAFRSRDGEIMNVLTSIDSGIQANPVMDAEFTPLRMRGRSSLRG